MSIRRLALVWLAALLGVVGAASAVASYLLMQAETNNFLDSQLRQIAYYIGDAPREPLHSAPSDPLYEAEDDFVVQIWGAGGAKLYDSDPDIPIARQSKDGFSNLVAKGQTWRTFSFVAPNRTVQVSQDMSVRDELAADAALRSAVPVAIILPLAWLLLGFVINGVMRRLGAVIVTVEAQDATTRRPIPLEDVPVEIRPLVKAMNDLVDRLQMAMEKQRRFVSDAAHELRTPLAALALQIGNLRQVTRGKAMSSRLDDVEAGARRANSLVSQLLRLARYEADQDTGAMETVAMETVDMASLIRATVEELAYLAAAKRVEIRNEGGELSVQGRAKDFSVLISNLIENAVKYSHAGGLVEISTGRQDEGAIITIRDDGPGIPSSMIERVFERFVRGVEADIAGSGLGLAIVRSIADRHGLSVAVENRTDRPGLIVRVGVPPTLVAPADSQPA